MKILLAIIIVAFSIYGADFKYENLLQGMPNNFKLGYKNFNQKTSTRLFEYIPRNEKIEDWSRMITTSIYHRNINLTAIEYIQKIKLMWKNSCKNNYTKILRNSTENGYKVALIMLYCPKSKITNKEELAFLKAIKGNDSFYSVQKAFTYKPSKKEVIATMQYLRKVKVCDTRLGNCPKITK